MSGPCRSAVSRAVMSVLQARHEGPGFKASKIRTKRSFLCGEIGSLLGFLHSVSNQPSQHVQRYMAPRNPCQEPGRQTVLQRCDRPANGGRERPSRRAAKTKFDESAVH